MGGTNTVCSYGYIHCHKNVPLHCPCRRTVNSEQSRQVKVGLLVLSSIARKYINKFFGAPAMVLILFFAIFIYNYSGQTENV